LAGQRGEQLARGRLLHEAHERFERTKVERIGRVGGKRRSQPELGCHAAADGGDQHSAPNIRKEVAPCLCSFHFQLLKVECSFGVRP